MLKILKSKTIVITFVFIMLLSGCGNTSTNTSTNTNSNNSNTNSTGTSSQIVYITKSGEKYHKDGCQYLSKSKIEITLEKAKDRGYTACSKCNPPE